MVPVRLPGGGGLALGVHPGRRVVDLPGMEAVALAALLLLAWRCPPHLLDEALRGAWVRFHD